MHIRNAKEDIRFVTWIDINGKTKFNLQKVLKSIISEFLNLKGWLKKMYQNASKSSYDSLETRKLFGLEHCCKANPSWITAKSCYAKGPCCISYKAIQIQGP